MTATPKTSKSKPLSMRIIHKGLAIVLLPLVVNTVWILMLNNCLESTEHLAELERSQSILLQHINSSFFKFAAVMTSLTSYVATGDPRLKAQYLSQLQEVQNELKYLQSASRYRTTMQKFAAEVFDTAETHFSEMEQFSVPNNSESFADSIQKFKSFERFARRVSATNQELQKHIADQQKELDKIHRTQDKERKRTRFVVFTGLAANLVLAIVLTAGFVGDITRRLKVLVENANRLPRYLVLKNSVTGGDELRELDMALHKAADELAKAKDYRTSLMQMMAHDLRAPLASISVSLEVMAKTKQQELDAGSLKQIKSMNSSIGRLLAIINDLLILDRLEHNELSLDLAPENIKEVCQVAIESVAGLAEQKQLSLQNHAEKNYAVFDRERILQVLVNYLSNAIKHSPTNGVISIEAALEPSSDGEKWLHVSVSDQGPGLTESESAVLFEKFRQLKEGEKAGGSGLGLALCKLIVTAHGGEVGVSSEQGKGSTFWFTLPVQEDEEETGNATLA